MAKAEIVLEQHLPTRGEWNGRGTFSQNGTQITYSNSAYFLLTPEVQEVLEEMLALVLREVGIGPKLEVYGTAASDEMEAHLVVSVKTDLPAREAFALWERLGDAVQEWTAALPTPQQDTALDIAVEVLWDADHAAV